MIPRERFYLVLAFIFNLSFGQSLPTILTQPKRTAVVVGTPASFEVSASGANLTYQWNKNGAQIVGATSASYKIDSASSSHVGYYHVVVSNTSGSVQSPVGA